MKRVEVKWLDSVRVEAVWDDEIDVKPRDLRHTSVGFLAKQNRHYVVVCSSKQDTSANVLGCIVIPRRAIVEMREL